MARLKVSAVLKKTRRTLTDAFRWLKHVLFLKKIDLILQRKKRRLAEKEKPLSATPKKPKSKDIVSVETLKSTEQKGRTKAKAKKAKRSRKAAER